MNKLSSVTVLSTFLCAAILNIGCSSRMDNDQAGIEGTGDTMTSRGVVTKFGSIYVNGIHFNTDEATFSIEGEEVQEEDIIQGMVVSVVGTPGETASEAKAIQVDFRYIVTAEIQAIDADASNYLYLTLPGYSVVVAENTVFEGTSYDELIVGDTVSVSGLLMEDGVLYASQITEQDDSVRTTSLQGIVSNINTTEHTLVLNGLTVDYANISAISSLEVGAQLHVSGVLNQDPNPVLVAESMEIIPPKEPTSGRVTTEEGFIESVTSEGNFTLRGMTVNTESAQFSGGDQTDLAAKVRVSVRGTFRQGQIDASEVRLILPADFRTSGKVSYVSNSDSTERTFTVSGITFTVDHFTAFDDRDTFANRYFDFPELKVDDQVDVYARKSDNGWRAVTVRREPQSDNPFSIRGWIKGFDPEGNFYLHDILVNIEGVPEEDRWNYQVGHEVYVIGSMDQGVLYATAVFPALKGCSFWDFDACRPPPPEPMEPFFPNDRDAPKFGPGMNPDSRP